MTTLRLTTIDLSVTALTIASVLHYGWSPFSPAIGSAAAVGYNAIFAMGAIVCIVAASGLRRDGAPRAARTWALIAAGLVAILIAQTLPYFVAPPRGALLSDITALLYYPLIVGAFWRMLPNLPAAGIRRAAVLDLALVWVAALTIMLAMLTRGSEQGGWSDLPSLAYRTVSPSMALVAVAAVASWLAASPAADRTGLRWAAAATVWVAIGDLVLNVFPADWNRWSNVAWAIGVWILVLGAQRVRPDGDESTASPRAVVGLSGAIPVATAGALVVALLGWLFLNGEPEAVLLAAGGVLLVLLLLVRHGLALRAASALERTRAEQEVRLRESERLDALGRMARGVAHDFNGMLTAILGNAELALDSRPVEPEVREALQRIREASVTATGITRQLLDFARSGAVEAVEIDVSQVLRAQWRVLGPALPTNIAVELRAEEGPLRIRSGAGFVEQVLFNLVSNARDAMPTGGTLRVDLSGTPDAVRLIVADTGVGMDEATRRRIFEPFFSTKGDRGTGLGLATVYGIVRQGGGEIRVDSSLGRGTVFTLEFPRSA